MARIARSIRNLTLLLVAGTVTVDLALAQTADPAQAGAGAAALRSAGAGATADLAFPPTAADAPGTAQLAPAEENHDPNLEIVVVKGRADWRLPDLGSSLRDRREAEAKADQRIQVDALPLYHKLERDPDAEIFDEDPDLRGVRVGFLQVFKIGVGKRDRISDDRDTRD